MALHPARGWALGLCVMVWTVMALGVAAGLSGSNPAAFHTAIPTWLAVATWGIPAALAAYTWVAKRGAMIAVVVLIVAPLLRVASYTWAWIVPHIEPGAAGLPNGWYVAGLHVAMIGLVVIAAILTREDAAVRSGR